MRWGVVFSYIVLSAVALTGCKDDEKDQKGSDTVPPFSDNEYAIYMAYTYDSIPSATAKRILCSGIWNNPITKESVPTLHKLSPGRDEGVEVFDIFVTENKNIYAAGCFGNAAVYWKNDTEIELPDGRAATGIAVDSDSIVYTCGFQKEGYDESAKMWIGTKPVLLKNGTRANKISICNGKNFIAGYGTNVETEVEEPRYWIDGQSYNRLSQNHDEDLFGDYASIAKDIVSDGVNWWCVGRERNTAVGYLPKVWINRSNNDLTKDGPMSSLTSIKHEDGVFYIGGNDGYHAKYWTATQRSKKENRISNLKEYDLTSGATQAVVEDIDVLNGIVVCCGYERSKAGLTIA